jgi:hypothetical protein
MQAARSAPSPCGVLETCTPPEKFEEIRAAPVPDCMVSASKWVLGHDERPLDSTLELIDRVRAGRVDARNVAICLSGPQNQRPSEFF